MIEFHIHILNEVSFLQNCYANCSEGMLGESGTCLSSITYVTGTIRQVWVKMNFIPNTSYTNLQMSKIVASVLLKELPDMASSLEQSQPQENCLVLKFLIKTLVYANFTIMKNLQIFKGSTALLYGALKSKGVTWLRIDDKQLRCLQESKPKDTESSFIPVQVVTYGALLLISLIFVLHVIFLFVRRSRPSPEGECHQPNNQDHS